MKILFIRQYNPFYESSASSNRFRGLIEGLRKNGDTVDIAVVCGFVKPQEKLSINENGVYYLSKANHFSYWKTRFNNYIFDNIHAIYALKRFKQINYNSYDIIWITKDFQVLKLFTKISKELKVKTLMELNEYNDFYINANYNFLQAYKAKKANKLFQKVVNKVDNFAVMTNTLLEYYRKMVNHNANFIHLPMTVDISRFKNITNKPTYEFPYIGFCGSIDKAKDGVDILIKAFIKIAHKYPDIKLILAGFYTYDTPEILKIVTEYKMENRIKYIGSLDRTKIPNFVCNATVLALSRPESHQAEGGFPTKLGEYLAAEKPVCVTKVGEIPNYLEDNISAYMANPGDIDSFADALDRALSNPQKASKVAFAGRKIAETIFNSDIQARELSNFLKKNII